MGGKKKSKKKRRFPGKHEHVNDYEKFSKAKQREAELDAIDKRGGKNIGDIASGGRNRPSVSSVGTQRGHGFSVTSYGGTGINRYEEVYDPGLGRWVQKPVCRPSTFW